MPYSLILAWLERQHIKWRASEYCGWHFQRQEKKYVMAAFSVD